MGILYGMVGMAVLMGAIWADVTYTYEDGLWLVAVSVAPGAIAGVISGFTVAMTSLPEMVGLYNGFGGLAAAFTGYGLYLDPNSIYLVRHGTIIMEQTDHMLIVQAIALVLSIVIGMMTFTGSMIASFKLNGMIASKPVIVPYRGPITIILFALMIAFGVLSFTGDQTWNDRTLGITYLSIVGLLSSIYGIIATMAIGGGDMPVSICFLNSLSGFSTSATGFMLSNKALVVSGAFVGCSGIILTLVMCNAMNRSVMHVLLGGFGEGAKPKVVHKSHKKGVEDSDSTPEEEEEEQGTVQELTAEEVVTKLVNAKSVIIVPGYGMVCFIILFLFPALFSCFGLICLF